MKPRNNKGQFIKQEWTEEQLQILIEMYPNTHSIEVAALIGRSRRSVLNKAAQLKLRKSKEFLQILGKRLEVTGKTYRFPKGHIPQNRGKKQTEYMSQESIERTKATRLKKGSIPPNAVPIGYERISSKGGYIYIKVEGKKRLILKHRHVWEQHYGQIPKGYNIQFKDRNPLNCNIENLYIISRKDQARENYHDKYPLEVKQMIQIKGALQRQINKNTENE